MRVEALLVAASLTAVVAYAAPQFQDRVTSAGAIELTQTRSSTAVSLRSSALNQPHILQVSAIAGTEVSGTVMLDGRELSSFDENGIRLDLAPHLLPGRHTVQILGRYTPNGGVSVSFTGTQTRVSQQTSGDGTLDQTLIIEVRRE